MKRFGIIFESLLLATLILFSCGCNAGNPSSGERGAQNTSDKRLDTISQDEYILYQNVFYNGYAKKIDGQKLKKYGVFAVLHDAYNGIDRYYVWGYYDQTKCCDWQWEFNPQSGEELPPVGSLVTVEGTFVSDEAALDDYWIEEATVRTETVYTGTAYEFNMYVMSDTLERVQIVNFRRFPDAFEGKTFIGYGRIKSRNTLQDPYYDGSWDIGFSYSGNVPAIGTTVVLSGTVQNGGLNVQTLEPVD